MYDQAPTGPSRCSAIEAAVDRISLDNHELAKLAKDIGSAAVMLSLVCMTVVWIVVLFQ